MKKIFSVVLALMLLIPVSFAFVGCGNDSASGSKSVEGKTFKVTAVEAIFADDSLKQMVLNGDDGIAGTDDDMTIDQMNSDLYKDMGEEMAAVRIKLDNGVAKTWMVNEEGNKVVDSDATMYYTIEGNKITVYKDAAKQTKAEENSEFTIDNNKFYVIVEAEPGLSMKIIYEEVK